MSSSTRFPGKFLTKFGFDYGLKGDRLADGSVALIGIADSYVEAPLHADGAPEKTTLNGGGHWNLASPQFDAFLKLPDSLSDILATLDPDQNGLRLLGTLRDSLKAAIADKWDRRDDDCADDGIGDPGNTPGAADPGGTPGAADPGGIPGAADAAGTDSTVPLTKDSERQAQTEASLQSAELAIGGDDAEAPTASMQSFAVTSIPPPTIIERRVAAAGDDIEERATGGISSNVSDLDLGFDDDRANTVGLRFTGLDIPPGAIITNAYIQFTVDEVSTGTIALLIRGEDADDAAPFTTVKFNVSSRTQTDASVNWAPADWTTRGAAGLAQQTPDIAAIIQEIVDRAGWQALNDMVFLITGTGTRVAESFEGDAARAPLLHIEYYVPPESDPVVFNSPADSNSAANQLAELAAAGTAIGITASASDPDVGDTVTYSIDDARFVIDADTGVITRSSTGTIDFETQTSITLTVTATSSDRSFATQTYTLNILNSQEAVAFNTPADTNTATNRITQNAAAGTQVGITASASDPDAGSTITYSVNDSRFAIDANGVITRSGTGTLNSQTEPSIALTVTATSSDGSTDTESFNLQVGTGTSNQLPTSVSLVRTILTSQWSPASPDPSGIAYISHLGTLLVSDAEVDEMSIYTGKNLYEMSLGGQLVRSLTTASFSDEPSGVAYNPANRHLFFSDDTGTKSVYELNPGADGLYSTSDDIVTSFKTSTFGSSDPEGIAFDTKRGVLYVADGSAKIYTINPGANGKFEGAGDDIITNFSIGSLTNGDPCVEYDPVHDLLYIIKSRTEVAMLSTTGQLLGTLNISAAQARKPAGLALAPSSADANQMSLYIVDRGTDNDSNPNENDGKVYEFLLNPWLLA
jgi:hypothetical protein